MDSALGLSAYAIGELDPVRNGMPSTRTATPSDRPRRIQATVDLGVEVCRSFTQSSPLPWMFSKPGDTAHTNSTECRCSAAGAAAQRSASASRRSAHPSTNRVRHAPFSVMPTHTPQRGEQHD